MSCSKWMLQRRREMKLVVHRPNPAEGGGQREEGVQRNLERRWDEDQMVAKKTLLLAHTSKVSPDFINKFILLNFDNYNATDSHATTAEKLALANLLSLSIYFQWTVRCQYGPIGHPAVKHVDLVPEREDDTWLRNHRKTEKFALHWSKMNSAEACALVDGNTSGSDQFSKIKLIFHQNSSISLGICYLVQVIDFQFRLLVLGTFLV